MALSTKSNRVLETARQKVRERSFGTPEWEEAMQKVRDLVNKMEAAKPREEYCSVDSGIHRTRLLDGRII